MIVSQTAEYALRAVAWIAGAQDVAQTTQQIAAGTRVPAGYLAKVLRALVRRGLVRARRGTGGGFTLARPAHRISVFDVVQAVDPFDRIDRCPLGIPTHGKKLCALHRRLDEAVARLASDFSQVSMASLLGEQAPGQSLCPVPGRARSRLSLAPDE